MSNISFSYSIAWLMLLLVPAVVLALLPYFRLKRKYRRTRNRITSIVLHIIIMVLAVSVLAGFRINYAVPNKTNEIILLVDMSHSGERTNDKRDLFVQSILDKTDENFSVAIITFGRDAVLASPFSNDVSFVYDNYKAARKPDTSATDVAKALKFARETFTVPDSGKIVLVSDGIQTDGKANEEIMQVAAAGIKVDTVYVPDKIENDVLILDVIHPETVLPGIPAEFKLVLESSFVGSANVTITDSDANETRVTTLSKPVEFKASGDNEFSIWHTVVGDGLHSLTFKITPLKNNDDLNLDTLEINNEYRTFVNITIYSNILILQGRTGDADDLAQLLNENGDYDKVDVRDVNGINPDVNDLVDQYDQIILVNVSNADLQTNPGLDSAITDFVKIYGGGLLTFGGDNAYVETDMAGSDYQKLLPIEMKEYAPPIALVILIDRSQSMSQVTHSKENDISTNQPLIKRELAKRVANAVVKNLTDRDQVAVVTLETEYSTNLSLTPGTKKSTIYKEIEAIERGGSTNYTGAMKASASLLLGAQGDVEYRHIILISDGEPTDVRDTIRAQVRDNLDKGITMSTVFVGHTNYSSAGIGLMRELATLGGGRMYNNVYGYSDDVNLRPPTSYGTFLTQVAGDISGRQAVKNNEVEFVPKVVANMASHHTVSGVYGNVMPTLGGFYGGRVKKLSNQPVDVPVTTLYSMPLYAEWSVGKGRVGTYMSNFKRSDWAAGYFANTPEAAVGKTFIHNVIKGLLPTQDIKPQMIELTIQKQNYTTELKIAASLKEKTDYIKVDVYAPGSIGDPTTVLLPDMPPSRTAETGISVSTSFEFNEPGVYRIVVTTRNANDEAISRLVAYTAFSYSKEYYVFNDLEAAKAFMNSLTVDGRAFAADSSRGVTLDEMLNDAPYDIMRAFSVTSPRTYDPTILFIIIAVVLFLLDVAVRKFKFKWPWEIVRDKKLKKEMQHGKN